MREKIYLYNKLNEYRIKYKYFDIIDFCKFNNINLLISGNNNLFYDKELLNFLIDGNTSIIVVRKSINKNLVNELIISTIYNILLYKKYNLNFNYIKYQNNIINKVYNINEVNNIYNRNITLETIVPSYNIPLDLSNKINMNKILIMSKNYDTTVNLICERLNLLNCFKGNELLLNKIDRYYNYTN